MRDDDGYHELQPRRPDSDFAVIDLSAIPEGDARRSEAIRRLGYVNACRAASPVERTKAHVEAAIVLVAHTLSDRRRPHLSTVYRWCRAYEESGCDVRALIPTIKARGNRTPKVSGNPVSTFGDAKRERARVVANLIEEVIRDHYLRPTRPSIRSVHEVLRARIVAENTNRDPSDRLPIPHVSSVARRVQKLDPFETTAARYGRRLANEQFRSVKQGPLLVRPLERVECDHTRLDLMVVDPLTRLPLGRPWLTTLLDCYSKLVLGIYIASHHPSFVSVMQALRHAIRPKELLKETFPRLEHDWPAFGVPEVLVVDNGKEFHSRHFEDSCLQLGVQIDYAPPYCGAYKGSVERWFGTQNRRLLHELPGTTFSNLFDRGDYSAEKHAVISLDALIELVHTWIVDVYHQQIHRGINDLPYRRWSRGIVDAPPSLPSRLDELDVLVGCVTTRRITRSGVELFCLRYDSPDLASIRRQIPSREKAKIKYDPTDLSAVHVLDPSSGTFRQAQAVEAEYARGLTLWQHEVIKRFARQELAGRTDHHALSRARERIERIVVEERVVQTTLRGRQAAFRYSNKKPVTLLVETTQDAYERESPAPDTTIDQPGEARLCPPPLSVDSSWIAQYDLPRSRGKS